MLNSCTSVKKKVGPATENWSEDTLKVSKTQKYVGSTEESWSKCYDKFKGHGKIVMLNLVKFKSIVDFTVIEVSDIQKGKTGKETDLYYKKLAENLLKKTNVGRILYYGQSQDFLIGPQDEKGDAIVLVEYDLIDAFVNFVESNAYQKITGHRKASLEDSRLLPASNFNIQEN